MDFAKELFGVADAAANARSKIGDIRSAAEALRDASDQAKRAWSGSNIGYHATVYYGGLQPKPAGAQFSPEWCLIDRWPTHQPDPGWVQMDHDNAIHEILVLAGNSDIEQIKKVVASAGDALSDLKERAISILTAVDPEGSDKFLARQLRTIEGLQRADHKTIESSLLPRKSWSRDSLAMSQGIRSAPHQAVLAIWLSENLVDTGLETLEKSARESASHLRRISDHRDKAPSVGTKVFVGHGRSPVWRELNDFVEDRLGIPVDEFNSVPIAGIATTTRLSELLDAAAFAFLVLTAEDEQRDGTVRARENVVHEVGLFQGRLGFSKAIVLLEDGCQEFSNIYGLGQLRFPQGNIAPEFEDIRAVLEREGLI
jgi:predicted nucleotide-binding protein